MMRPCTDILSEGVFYETPTLAGATPAGTPQAQTFSDGGAILACAEG